MKKLSVVTVCYNVVDDIEKTILSVLNQTCYKDIQFIIIDGGSTDGTLEIINNYKDKIDLIISEPDKGIYDAMNKGINNANGEYINFMNAGDTYHSLNIIEQLIPYLGSEDVIYGKSFHYNNDLSFIRIPCPLEKIEEYNPFDHQATFIKTSVAKNQPYNLEYKNSADFDQLYQLYKQNKTFKYVDLILADRDGRKGFSKENFLILYKDNAKIRGIEKTFNFKANYLKLVIYHNLKKLFSRFIPHRIKVKRQKRVINNLIKKEWGEEISTK